MKLIKKIIIILLVFLVNAFTIAQDKPLFETNATQTLVYDNIGFLNPQNKQFLEQKLIQLDSETSIQILVAIVPDLYGYDKADYATRLMKNWGVGGKEDNGFVILINPKTNSSKGQVFITTGYGVEQFVTDALAKTIVDNEMIPQFKQNNYAQGIDNAINTIISITSGEFTGSQYLKNHKQSKKSGGLPIALIIMIVLAIFSFIGGKRRNNHSGMGRNGSSIPFWLLMGSAMGGSSSSGGFGGFSSGGGSFGGFGGGFGGGGGAGGSW